MRSTKATTMKHRGLATLELVLSLPILLMLMALMMNFGVVASWKVRALGASRNAVWSTRWPRGNVANPRPDSWPASAGLGAGVAGNVAGLDDPRVDLPVARGPLPLPGAEVNPDLLDPTRGLRQGTASMTRRYAMLAKMGSFHLESATTLLDDRWEHDRMFWTRGDETIEVPTNASWRIPVIYAIQTAAALYADNYLQAALAIYYAPFRDALSPLDRDDEFIAYRGSAPDFHPHLRRFCSLDRAEADERVNDLIDRIRGRDDPPVPQLAEHMARAFIGLYREMIDDYQSQITNVPGANVAMLQNLINQLQRKIEQLERFLDTLQN